MNNWEAYYCNQHLTKELSDRIYVRNNSSEPLEAHINCRSVDTRRTMPINDCRKKFNDCAIFQINDNVMNTRTASSYNSGSSSYGNSYSNSNTNSQPQLFYDPSTNGMRECAYDGLSNGKCLSFKSSLKTYTANTLFYNKNTGAMQPCAGSVNTLGQCSAFGLFNARF